MQDVEVKVDAALIEQLREGYAQLATICLSGCFSKPLAVV